MLRPDSNSPTLYLTAGEPAGIGPELVLKAAQQFRGIHLAIVADRDLLATTADNLRLDSRFLTGGTIEIVHCPLQAPVVTGQLNPANSAYVLETLRHAAGLCLGNPRSGLVTGPVHKGVINDSGVAFSGHTEFLADISGAKKVVMMLASNSMRVALVTTHLPLRDVANAITKNEVLETIRIVATELRRLFLIDKPRLNVCGLNPHAGEGGHLGDEEALFISPAIEECRKAGISVNGPLPADTAFTGKHLAQCDATIAMFHDQGLPVIKHSGFGEAVNITLGLPFVRTSVDHGTGLDIAGTGAANAGSLLEAIRVAAEMITR